MNNNKHIKKFDDKVLELNKSNMSETKAATLFAEHQLIGYFHAKEGYDLMSLIENIGLSRTEWEKIKEKDNFDKNNSEVKEVDKYFYKKIF